MKKLFLMCSLCLLMGIAGCSGEEVASSPLLKTNLPFSIRRQMSLVIRKSVVEKELGKADITRESGLWEYEVRKKDDGSVIFAIYNQENGILVDLWRLDRLYDRMDFESLVSGKSTMRDVVSIDPYVRVQNRGDGMGISEHRLVGGEIALIIYQKMDDEWLVEKVTFEKDYLEFSDIIAPDYGLIHYLWD